MDMSFIVWEEGRTYNVYPNHKMHSADDKKYATDFALLSDTTTPSCSNAWYHGESREPNFYQNYVCKPAGSNQSVLVKHAREVTATEVKV